MYIYIHTYPGEYGILKWSVSINRLTERTSHSSPDNCECISFWKSVHQCISSITANNKYFILLLRIIEKHTHIGGKKNMKQKRKWNIQVLHVDENPWERSDLGAAPEFSVVLIFLACVLHILQEQRHIMVICKESLLLELMRSLHTTVKCVTALRVWAGVLFCLFLEAKCYNVIFWVIIHLQNKPSPQ